jgi:5-methylcytosine-specific restriction endonuclease McrA
VAHTGSDWGGRKAQAWSAAVLAAHLGPGGEPASCWLELPGCTGLATTADHLIPRQDRPDLAYVLENGRPACLPCNSKRQGTPIHRLHLIGGRESATIDQSAFFDGV